MKGSGFSKKKSVGHRSHVNGTRHFMKVKGFRDKLELDTQRLIKKYVKPKGRA